jgi:hypothetical protein
MQRVVLRGLALLAFGLAVLPLRPVTAADTPFKGTWKMTVTDSGSDLILALLRVEGNDAAPTVTVVDNGIPEIFQDVKVEAVRGDAAGLRFTLVARGNAYRFAAARSRSDPKVLLGSVQIQNQLMPIVLERTNDTEIDPRNVVKKTPGTEGIKELRGAEPDRQDELFKGLVEKYPERPVLVLASREILLARTKNAAAPNKLKPAADAYLKSAALFGPELELHAAVEAARFLNDMDKGGPALAIDYARKAERMLPADAPASRKAEVLKTLAAVLKKNNRADELKTVQARLAKLEDDLDAEFKKTAVPFKPEGFPGRKSNSQRACVVELFTGAHCPPCVAADVAFDALPLRYSPKDVILLQYHLHIPQPDPLTGEASQKRGDAYNVDSTPTVFLNGKSGPSLGGRKADAEDRFGTLSKAIDEALETTSPVNLSMAVARTGDSITINAESKWLDGKAGDKLRLRLVLVEETARYSGNNGQRLHHHVVRAFPGGIDGFAFQDEKVKQSVRVVLSDVRRQQDEFLTKQTKEMRFLDDARPLEMKQLKIVALVQDDASGEILQALQSDVPEAK